MKDVRNSDGTLKNGIVNFNSLALGLQLTVDPTNGQLVAAAVATAQAAQTAASGSATGRRQFGNQFVQQRGSGGSLGERREPGAISAESGQPCRPRQPIHFTQ